MSELLDDEALRSLRAFITLTKTLSASELTEAERRRREGILSTLERMGRSTQDTLESRRALDRALADATALGNAIAARRRGAPKAAPLTQEARRRAADVKKASVELGRRRAEADKARTRYESYVAEMKAVDPYSRRPRRPSSNEEDFARRLLAAATTAEHQCSRVTIGLVIAARAYSVARHGRVIKPIEQKARIVERAASKALQHGATPERRKK